MSTISIVLFTIASTLLIPGIVVVLTVGAIRVFKFIDSLGEHGLAWAAIGLWATVIFILFTLGRCWMDDFPEIHADAQTSISEQEGDNR